MMEMIYARWLLLKRQLPKILLWLILPLLLTLSMTALFNSTSDDFRIPAAVVVHEQSEEAANFIEGLNDSEFMDIEVFDAENSAAALRALEQYRLDSVFILPENFNEKIQQGQRRDLIETHYTDRSIYYEPAKELAASVVQAQMGEHTTVNHVMQLQDDLLSEIKVNGEDVAAERERIETETNLLEQIFYFLGEQEKKENSNTINPWIVWAYSSFIVTIFIFDFVTRETISSTKIRFNFTKYSYTKFMMLTFFLLTVVMVVIDIITYVTMTEILSANISFLSLITYRIIINGLAFLLASSVSSTMNLYRSAVILTIAIFVLQLLMPVIVSLTGITILPSLHPVLMFIENKYNIPWLVFIIILMLVWIWRDNNAGN